MTSQPTVVVAVDFSESSASAYRFAADLAAQLPATLRVLHITERRDWQRDLLASEWLLAMDVAAESVTALPGNPWVQINRFCDAERPLFLVVGSHGHGGYQPLRPGSTTAFLLARSPVPVLVVPQKLIRKTHLPERRSSHV